MKTLKTLAFTASLLATAPAFAEWKSVDDMSRVAFGSIKGDVTGEVHHFNQVSGTVSDDGKLAMTIDLASIETNIDIRNERMMAHVFDKGKATATLTGEIDMDEVNALKPGDSTIVEVFTTLAFAGTENDIDARMLVVRLAEDKVLVTTEDFLMISTEDLGIEGGIDTLMQLASLSGITRVTPVSVRMVFKK